MSNQANNNVIGRVLRRLLADEGVSIVMLSEWVGIHENTIQNWMGARYQPKAEMLFRVARVMRKPMEYFFEEENA